MTQILEICKADNPHKEQTRPVALYPRFVALTREPALPPIAPLCDLRDLPFERRRYRALRPLLFKDLAGRLLLPGDLPQSCHPNPDSACLLDRVSDHRAAVPWVAWAASTHSDRISTAECRPIGNDIFVSHCDARSGERPIHTCMFVVSLSVRPQELPIIYRWSCLTFAVVRRITRQVGFGSEEASLWRNVVDCPVQNGNILTMLVQRLSATLTRILRSSIVTSIMIEISCIRNPLCF